MYRGLFLWGWSGRGVNLTIHHYLSNAEVKNAWSYTSTHNTSSCLGA
jgi:hypothetical protein